MPRIDDYKNARKLAIEKLTTLSFDTILQRTGFESVEANRFRVSFLKRVYHISFPELEFEDEAESQKEVPIQEQILILHYMLGPAPSALTDNWISYREIPGASFYYSAFVKRAIDPLKQVFGQNVDGLIRAGEILGGKSIDTGDAGYEFKLFPNIPVRLILWAADDEFPAEANIVFNENIGGILSPEDIAWLAGMVVYRLISLSK
ncbi:MAG: DUF3786 domain-containing protein [Desulfobacterales bacterium]|jgi:hypothetical protein|nr:DUF3786 domain-containing protein [Desulfobacterales bacterium]